MRKRKVGRKFNRTRDQRKALLKSLARNLILHDHIVVSEARAKELRPFIEKLITKARVDSVATVRYLKTYFDDAIVWKLTKQVAPRYSERPGGYTRITKLAPATRDMKKLARIEFIA